MFALFTDTDTDITLQQANSFGYHLISMPYSYEDKIVFPYEDFTEFNSHVFYDMLRSGILPSTSAISEEKYIEYFEPYFAKGEDILYVHFSRAMTATFDSMDRAVAKLLEKYPGRRFEEIDTMAITILSLLIVEEIGDLYKAGKSMDEILEYAKENVMHNAVFFYADNLKFFQKSGRVSGLAGTMGTLLGVRPILTITKEGKMESIGKETGRQKALNRVISYVDEMGEDVKNHRVIIGHCDSLSLAEAAGAKLKEKYGEDLRIEYVAVNPTAGSHCGPDTVGIAFHSKNRL